MKALKHGFFAWIFPWVPKRLLSRATGLLMRLPLPGPLAALLVPLFARFFKINAAEAELQPGEYHSLDGFFTRKLKAGIRPVGGQFVHPVDGKLTEQGKIEQGQLIQAKGWTYSVAEFLGDENLARIYEDGQFYTYYLCPADYHRVHSPTSGDLVSARHIPGLLWPVNEWSVHNIRRLFCLNERVVLNFEHPLGRWSLVFVGATNVGHMTITLDPSIISNRWMWHAPTERHYSPPLPVKPGDELGIFHLGSTVICLFEKGFNRGQLMPGSVLMGVGV
ncbi:MAG: phosphatidylserine decarboxylase [Bdellovibrionales bacterium]|nr:phosphatidylserine decarboxylase [Bdellovibrionales bacterium]